ncbi:MAG: phenylalanine--tRNA ligase subunit beta, partial [Deltaproteobacteria bacterium]|nr:phenylalanine--tRNA ligase subunit beta [Deltaproteobacteria bacterium]
TLSTAIGWNDVVFEIDNKSLTNRPDLWGHYGIARELAAIYGCKLKPLPAIDRDFPAANLLGEIEETACGRFAAVRISGVRVNTAPFWMRSRLVRVGQRPINLYVDITNYVMFAVGQPSHVYDTDRLQLPLGTRYSRKGEKVRLLDGKEYDLDPSILSIVDRKGPVAIAGIMGGAESSISGETREVLLELANFDALKVRRAATHLDLRSEASSRFEKGVDTQRVDAALNLFIGLVRQIQPTAPVTGFQDVLLHSARPKSIDVEISFIQDRLGKPLSADEIAQKLESFQFNVTRELETLHIVVPSWRSTGDVSMPHDIVEEVARLYGYDNFEFMAPEVRLERQTTDRRVLLERRLKELLAMTAGMQEIVSYPWVKDRFLEAAGFKLSDTLRINPAPASDQGSLQPSLIPNLLEGVVTNLRYFMSFRIFQAGPVFLKSEFKPLDDTHESLPEQPRHLAGAFVGPDADVLFREAKGLIETLKRAAHIHSLDFSPETSAPWADKGGRLGLEAHGRSVGAMGVLTNRAKRLAGIRRGNIVLFELNINALEPLESRENKYRPLPEYPEVDFDLSLIFPEEVLWRDLSQRVQDMHSLVREVIFVDQYRGKGIPEGKKSITFRLRLASPVRTLRSEEVSEVAHLVAKEVQATFGAAVRG